MSWVQRESKAGPSRNGGRGRARAYPQPEPFVSDRDYTQEIIAFLNDVHGNVRRNQVGDYFYGEVSAISLHFLLNSELPGKEILWSWYRHFDFERSESIYQTLRPQDDEVFLDVLAGCHFRWDAEAVRASGLVFLRSHRQQVYEAIEACMCRRLETYTSMDDEALRELLHPGNTWSEAHLRRLIRQIQTKPFGREARQAIYEGFTSPYLRATARHLMDEATTEMFWKLPLPELESMLARFAAFRQAMLEASRRLGVYVSREAYEWAGWNGTAEGQRRSARGRGKAKARARAFGLREREAAHYAILGLKPSATLPEVKTAYREKVKQYHPDQGGTVQEFLRVQEAYEYLLSEVYA